MPVTEALLEVYFHGQNLGPNAGRKFKVIPVSTTVLQIHTWATQYATDNNVEFVSYQVHQLEE